MLKKTIRFVSYAMAFIGLGGVQTSCNKDNDGELCYRCTYTDYDTQSETICFGDYKTEYPDATKTSFQEYITNYWTEYGWTCKKKSLE